MRRCTTSVVVIVIALVATACSNSVNPTTSAQRTAAAGGTIRVASYDFSESLLLAQMYAIALRDNGFDARLVPELGSRELVDPALIQGRVDLVPEYVGTALNFLTSATSSSANDVQASYAQLRKEFDDQGVVTLHYAAAQDRNGFAVSRTAAARNHWTRISDLAPDAGKLVFGGPAECAERDLCLVGLRATYGLRFREFRPFTEQSVTAQALVTGEIDVGLLDTTNGALKDRRLLLLRDDRGLQPAENVVPVVNGDTFRRLGPRLADVVNAVSAHLDTADLVKMNRAVDVDGRDPRAVATEWLRDNGLLTGHN